MANGFDNQATSGWRLATGLNHAPNFIRIPQNEIRNSFKL
jgi:hypothetical protein